MRNDVRYTTAERMSFQVIPETCPDIEKAFDTAREFNLDHAAAELRSYGIEPDKQLLYAIDAILGKAISAKMHDLRIAVLYKGTFPLRLALVEVMEDVIRLKGGSPEPSNFKRWLDERKRIEELE